MNVSITLPLTALGSADRPIRRTEAGKEADAELRASILAHGLLEGLVVERLDEPGEDDVPTAGEYRVVAGRRRLLVLRDLAGDGEIAADHPVPVTIVPGETSPEAALAENQVRVAMHPADMVEAFAALARKGADAAEIGARFGQSPEWVARRLRLAGVAKPIIEAWRSGEIDERAVRALAVTADKETQMQVYRDAVGSWGGADADNISGHMDERMASSDNPIAKYATIDAYRKAGGALEERLFEEGVWVADWPLMERIAREKLVRYAARIAKRGPWKWAELADPIDRRPYVYPEGVGRLYAETPEHKDRCGCLVYISDGGKSGKIEWLLKREDHDALAAEAEKAREAWDAKNAARREARAKAETAKKDAPDDAPEAPAPEEEEPPKGFLSSLTGRTAPTASRSDEPKDPSELPASVRDSMRTMREAIARAVLERHPLVATDYLAFAMAHGMYSEGFYSSIIDGVRVSRPHNPPAEKVPEALQPRPDPERADLSFLEKDRPADAFRAFLELSRQKRGKVLAHCVAALTVGSLSDDRDGAAFEGLVEALDIDFAAEIEGRVDMPWTADMIWSRLTKGGILSIAGDNLPEDWMENAAKMKKGDLAAAAADGMRNVRGWLPAGVGRATGGDGDE